MNCDNMEEDVSSDDDDGSSACFLWILWTQCTTESSSSRSWSMLMNVAMLAILFSNTCGKRRKHFFSRRSPSRVVRHDRHKAGIRIVHLSSVVAHLFFVHVGLRNSWRYMVHSVGRSITEKDGDTDHLLAGIHQSVLCDQLVLCTCLGLYAQS